MLRDREDEKTSNILYNILHTMSLSRNNCIDAEDFSKIDFKDVALHTYNFSGNCQTPSKFDGAKLYNENLFSIVLPIVNDIETSQNNDLMILSGKSGQIQLWKLSKRVLKDQLTIKDLIKWKYMDHDNSIVFVLKNGIILKYSIIEKKFSNYNIASASEFATFYGEDQLYFIDNKKLYLVELQALFSENGKYKTLISINDDYKNTEWLFVDNKENIYIVAKKRMHIISSDGQCLHDIELDKDVSFFVCLNDYIVAASKDLVYVFNDELIPQTVLCKFSHKIICLNQVRDHIAICLENGDVELYNIKTKSITRWKPHNLGVISIHEHEDYCITSSIDNTVCFWKYTDYCHFIKINTMQSYIASFVQTNDNDSCFAVASQFHSVIEVWDTKNSKKYRYIDTHTDGISSLKVFTDIAIFSTFSGNLLLWNWTNNRHITKSFGYQILRMDTIDNGRIICLLVQKVKQKMILLYNTDSESIIEVAPASKQPTTIRFLSKNHFAVAGLDGLIEIYDLKGHLLSCTYPYGFPNSIYDLHLSYNGVMLGVQFFSSISFFSLYDIKNMIPCSDYISNKYISSAAQYKKSNLFLLYDINDCEIKVITIHGAQIRHILPCQENIMSFTTSADKKLIIAGSNNSVIYKFTNFVNEPQKLFYLPEFHISGCSFVNVICNEKIREVLRQQGATL